MLNPHTLFTERLKSHMKELNRYLKYILTGHLAIAMFFIFSALAVYYQKWLEQLPATFPVALIISLLLGLVATHSPIQTMLKKADIVFLIPAEYRLKGYFRRTLIYSYITQIYLFLFVYAALAPLYLTVYEGKTYGLLFLVLLIIKGWSLVANWWMLKVRDSSMRAVDVIVRYFLISAIIYFFIKQELILLLMVTVMLIGLLIYNFSLSKRQKAINWEVLIERDYVRMRSFYRLANMFTDVPHLETSVKKRAVIARVLTGAIPFQQNSSYTYLYRLTTARSGEYFGIYLRLLVIGALLILFVPNVWLKLIFAILFSYMTFIQLMPLWKHHTTIIWLDLYPVANNVRQESFIKWLQQLMFVQMLLFAVFLLIIESYITGGLMVIAAVTFTFLFVPRYVSAKISGKKT
ncbi:ABC-2 type transport system permease protein [Gracilibacillus ureilyticus]|uniref:ABC-2 type transport system permease protein n=1 Tax=Gracilibacillus ureilyticus TaxID=531814 RepID=A0A1H9SKF2_9BACI|nr:ABC transporter permease [Gracilibacillus ureilyticus]SER85496.1 ABC-2 type transport system permease protein [Gracilibacillus ureilyticus]